MDGAFGKSQCCSAIQQHGKAELEAYCLAQCVVHARLPAGATRLESVEDIGIDAQ
jgi:hypothetical protein